MFVPDMVLFTSIAGRAISKGYSNISKLFGVPCQSLKVARETFFDGRNHSLLYQLGFTGRISTVKRIENVFAVVLFHK